MDDQPWADTVSVESNVLPITPSVPLVSQSPELVLLQDDSFSSSEILKSSTAMIANDIFPTVRMLAATESDSETGTVIHKSMLQLSNTSKQLWTNLRQTPTPSPSKWRTSRIRRSYLVSLGIPVDLDQVLPTKKTEKIRLSDKSSIESDTSRTMHFDADRALTLSRVTEAALQNMSHEEVEAHVRELEKLKIEASTVLAYWIDKLNTSAQDKTKYESVIESSIEYAQRLRKHTTRVAAIPRPSSALGRSRSLNLNG
ncbi:hypothetical protein V1512DRAFT_262148 [Lipomyces arxii]|uniref:uncharacterized protein n=1 Tax=Lipomyces arxii TaxID=56418 RepID=UPI0034CFF180